MVDEDRISDLRHEIGEEDLAIVLGMFLSEAQRMIDAIATGLSDDAHARATHFLRSGALNIGFVAFAAAADHAAAAAETARAATAPRLSEILTASAASLSLRMHAGHPG
ncbi:MAG: hypothetical protein WBA67_03195 [Jannaschia sp.]